MWRRSCRLKYTRASAPSPPFAVFPDIWSYRATNSKIFSTPKAGSAWQRTNLIYLHVDAVKVFYFQVAYSRALDFRKSSIPSFIAIRRNVQRNVSPETKSKKKNTKLTRPHHFNRSEIDKAKSRKLKNTATRDVKHSLVGLLSAFIEALARYSKKLWNLFKMAYQKK